MLKRGQVVSGALTFCLAALLFMIVPIMSAPTRPYDPWMDKEDDGKIGPSDLAWLIAHYGGTGDPLTKAALLYDSGWLNLTGETGLHYTVVHSLNLSNAEVVVDARAHADEWNQTYGNPNSDEVATCVVQTVDGGYALAGYAHTFDQGFFRLVKTDRNGNMQWNKTYGEGNAELLSGLAQTSDGGYVIAGTILTDEPSTDHILIVKTDIDGNVQWNKTYGGEDNNAVLSMVETRDMGYFLGGFLSMTSTGYFDALAVKTDANGNMQWNKTYGGTGDDATFSVIQTSDGGYALAGRTSSYGVGMRDFWLVKTDVSGVMEWNQTYGGTGEDLALSVIETEDGGYALAGWTNSSGAGNIDAWLVKTDSGGNMLWNETYGGANDDYASSVIQTSDGGYLIAGGTGSSGSGSIDFWLIRTDSNGKMLWNKMYGGASADFACSLIQTDDRGLALAGYTHSNVTGDSDFWLVKTAAESGLAWVDLASNSITLCRSETEPCWYFVRVRIWKIKETP